MSWLNLLAVAALGYLVGGIPTAYLAGRLRGIDIRTQGSGNVGGTNALRVMGWRWGLPVMAVDVGKGYLATRLLPALSFSPLEGVHLAIAAGVGAVLGHIFSPYLAFRGGKGVATGAGMLLALIPGPVGICAVIFLAVAFGTGIVSLGSLSAGAALPLVTWLWGRGVTPVPPAVHWLTVALALLVFWTHRSNIRRLLQGRENRFRRPWERRS